MPISPGDTVGPYRIIEPLGQGGMATVYKAYHSVLDRNVAIKVMHPAFSQDPNFYARFVREARIVARLEHPNIVPIHDFAEFEGTPYLVMRLIEGRTLKAVMREGLLPVPRVLQVILPVTQALAYAHSQGVLHRDIKPSNIMCEDDGHIFLTDFGLARLALATDSTLSQDMLIGTPQYISPEQARGEPATPRSDVYSLGVVLFEMFTGRVPFNSDTPYAIIHDHIYTPLPSPVSLNPSISQELEAVLAKALAKDPGARYDVPELMTALEQATGVEMAAVVSVPAPFPPAGKVVLPPQSVPEPMEPVSTAKSRSKLVRKHVVPEPIAAETKPAHLPSLKLLAVIGLTVLALIVILGLVLVVGERNAIAKALGINASTPTPNTLNAARTRVALNAQDAQAHILLGDELARAGDSVGAFAEYDRAIRLAPKNAHAFAQAGELATSAGKFDLAEKYFAQGRAIAPENVELLLGQGDNYFKWKKYDEARTSYDSALKVEPNNAQIIWRIGNVQRIQGQLAESLRSYTRALTIDPNLPEAHLGMGMLMLDRGNKEEARRQFQLVLSNSNSTVDQKDQAQKQLNALGDK